MKGYVTNIEDDTMKNQDFRRVLYTGKNSQLVLMSLQPKEEIGLETHTLDQFIRWIRLGCRPASLQDHVRRHRRREWSAGGCS